ncbi:MAG: M20 family metallopeptidase [Myxococcota bacterium]
MSFPLLDWAGRFISTPSVSREGNREVAELAVEMLRSIGLDPVLDPACGKDRTQVNVVADLGRPTARSGGLLLVTHLDTVPPGDPSRWTATAGDPFAPTLVGDRLYGLGSADAKVDLCCKAVGLASLAGQPLRHPVRVVATFGEEIGLLGARHLCANGGARGFEMALVGEPSGLTAIHAHKGYAVFEARLPVRAESTRAGDSELLEVAGESAHSSTPHLGRNAIEVALERIARAGEVGVAALEGGGSVNQVPDRCRVQLGRGYPAGPLAAFHTAWRRLRASLEERRDPRFDPPFTVGNLGRVELRDRRPVFRFDLRPVPGVDPIAAVAPLQESAEVELLRANPPLETDSDGPLMRTLCASMQALGLPVRTGTKATCTEAGLLSREGLQAVVIGAGESVGNVHRPNEHTLVSQLHQMSELYTRALQRLACGGPA